MDSVRWGFVSTAEIGQKNWQAIKQSGNGRITAVASRSEASAASFIDKCQGWCPYDEKPAAIGDYQELVQSDLVDAVYIPLPTGMRKALVIQAANAGKHVMCEKPCAANADDLAEMIAACKANNVQFMDGVMFMHTERLQKIRQTIDEGAIGKLKRIATQFSFCADDEWLSNNIRMNSDLEPQGCLGDLGWYCIRFALFVNNWQMPQRVTANIISDGQRQDSPGPVPTEFSAELFFDNGVSASFYCSFINHHQQWSNISGDKGYLHVNDFVLPYKGNVARFDVSKADFSVDGCDFEMIDDRRSVETTESANSAADSQEVKLFRAFNTLALSGTPNLDWPEYSLKTQTVLDQCLQAARS